MSRLKDLQQKAKERHSERIRKYIDVVRCERVVPDEKKIITRYPAIYSNKSPYGIASELLFSQR